jgi:hypothetical protein
VSREVVAARVTPPEQFAAPAPHELLVDEETQESPRQDRQEHVARGHADRQSSPEKEPERQDRSPLDAIPAHGSPPDKCDHERTLTPCIVPNVLPVSHPPGESDKIFWQIGRIGL